MLPESDSVLPAEATGWNKDQEAEKVGITVTNGASTIDGSQLTAWTYAANIVPDTKISVEDGAIVYDVDVTDGVDCTVVIYVAPRGVESVNAGGGHYVYFTDFNGYESNKLTTGKGVITAKQILARLVEKRSAWGYTPEAVAEMTELDIVEFRVYLNNGTSLTINTLGLVGEVTD